MRIGLWAAIGAALAVAAAASTCMGAERREIIDGTEVATSYARAVRVGTQVFVSGTTSLDEKGNIVGEGDAAAQTRRTLEKIEAALVAAGAGKRHIVRTTVHVVGKENIPGVIKALGEYFGPPRPASSLLMSAGLLKPGLLVEIETTAVIGD